MSIETTSNQTDAPRILERAGVDGVIRALRDLSYNVLGPTVRDGAIVYDDIGSTSDLPIGWTDEQEAGTYRLVPRTDGKLFAYNVGPNSWKQFLLPSSVMLTRAERDGAGFKVVDEAPDAPRQAFFGVRACELRAIAVQDRVLLGREFKDAIYEARRANTFIVAVNCGKATGTCFCVSMGSGPKATSGFDLALTEVQSNGSHYFVAQAGSERGGKLLAGIPSREATMAELQAADGVTAEAAAQMGRKMNTDGIQDLFKKNRDSKLWSAVADRCLTCGNCTLVCPTCFCTKVQDTTDLTGDHAERWRRWDSCFTVNFSYIHGGSVRPTSSARYRHWITHKLATWHDQFGESGCVGCGRCISWCPVGIDITAEAQNLRDEVSHGKP
jgi:formate hydrogenlyase subunit 6/NADH:ubiquinone oxidoreductase subunit I